MATVGDDYLSQEQYILELPDDITKLTEDPTFQFELVFDQSGRTGKFVSSQTKENQYIFRIYTLPLVTESYTSMNNDIFYKNADIGQIIIVFNKDEPPQILKDYENLQQILLYKASNYAFPTGDVLPHGLTPPSRWAPLQLYPQLPLRPKWAKPVPIGDVTQISFKEQVQKQGDATLDSKIDEINSKIKELDVELEQKYEQKHNNERDGRTENNQIDDDIRRIKGELEELHQQKHSLEAQRQQGAENRPRRQQRRSRKE